MGDTVGAIIGAVITLLIFSYLLSDNFLYRLSVYIFVGVAAGYAAVVAVEGVVLPWLRGTLLAPGANTGQIVLGVLPLLVGLLLLLKAVPRLAFVGHLGMAFLIGIGTADANAVRRKLYRMSFPFGGLKVADLASSFGSSSVRSLRHWSAASA